MAAMPRWNDMALGAFQHPEDQKALEALQRIPGVDWAMQHLIKHSYETLHRITLTANAIQVDSDTYPVLNGMLAETASVLGVPAPTLFVKSDPRPLARAQGVEAPHIVFHTGLLDLLDPEEMHCMVAHQVSHLHCRHMLHLMLSHFLRAFASHLGVMGNAVLASRLAVEEWRRRADYSCDRGALLVTANQPALERMLCKLAGARASSGYGDVSPDGLCRQADAFDRLADDDRLGRVYRVMMYLDETHAAVPLRLRELRRWVDSGAYATLCDGEYPRREAELPEDGPALWGAFMPPGADAFYEEARLKAADESLADSIRLFADETSDLLQEGASALGNAVGSFFQALQRGRAENKTVIPDAPVEQTPPASSSRGGSES